MKTKYILTLLIAGSAMFAGCKKSFLDAEPSSEFLTPEQLNRAAKQDPNVLNGTVNGLYTAMFTYGIGGTTGHDDFGQKGIDIYSDMLAGDMVLGATIYGWYRDIAHLTATNDFTRNENYIPWRFYYRIIYGANTVIDILGGNDAQLTTAENKYTMGQAKAMRAYAYFYLTQLYSREGYGNGTQKILPIYTTAKETNKPKATAKEVWDLMVADLTQAVNYLNGFRRGAKNEVDQDVAKGLFAYVLAARAGATQSQADWTKVEQLTSDIMADYPVTKANEVVAQLDANGNVINKGLAGFNSVTTPSWMWGVDLTLAQGIDLVSFWGQVDLFTYSYAWAGDTKIINSNLYDAIPTGDVRKKQFDPENGGLEPLYGYSAGDFDYMPLNKFYDPGRVDGGQRQVVTDLIYMRADEFYLLNAEANAHLGNESAAKASLEELLDERMDDPTLYLAGLSGQALLDAIYLQTRMELWGEGKSYLAMKRNKATIKEGANHLYFPDQTFPYNDDRLTLEIPQAETINNPNLNK